MQNFWMKVRGDFYNVNITSIQGMQLCMVDIMNEQVTFEFPQKEACRFQAKRVDPSLLREFAHRIESYLQS
ncbi:MULTISPECIES: hypothetical protein [Olivibacter]|jgi:hypothetical protein|uniref:Uncharacterized protein n=2 Tax=Olivibacter TaxID=376469 RepID=A0ABV6HMF7_9SPHI|nr:MULTISPECIES: hypothetical protein [Olivibacter]MCL4640183.1 hypothetical protein [Olivibacter sp. UJ_SKK_5.1]MDM8173048.1 hypothetical protein [Olivibacter sp. 47]MDX3915523.1 hypothetical protein [Pseudosphingobacterium sp.]QEL02835.1 hypothetical protein FKG96_19100 [Olivibacter sp. LS-1]